MYIYIYIHMYIYIYVYICIYIYMYIYIYITPDKWPFIGLMMGTLSRILAGCRRASSALSTFAISEPGSDGVGV